MNKIQTYYLISKLLSLNSVPGNKAIVVEILQSSAINWSVFVNTASNHLVLQTIYCKLMQHGLTEYVPSEVLEHLRYVYELNYERNTGILEQVATINKLLLSNDIVPMYLKGVGNIMDGLYENIGERIMHDIDFLVPDNQWEMAVNVLLNEGYHAIRKYEPEKRGYLKHYPTLFKSGERASVEVHRLPVDFIYSGTLDIEEVWSKKKFISGFNCYVMSDNHKIIHNFIHSQLHHNGHLLAKVFLRNLYDLFLLAEHTDAELVLAGLNNYHTQAAGYLRIMNKAFVVKMPLHPAFKHFGIVYTLRHAVNLRSRKISIATRFAFKMVKAYIYLPFQSITDKNLRASLTKRLLNKHWYVQHFGTYRYILHGNNEVNT